MLKFDGDLLVDPSEYRHIVGALQYVTITRPDIAYYVNQLSQHMQAPTSTHWTSTKRVLRYLSILLILVFIINPVLLPYMPSVKQIGQVILMIDVFPVAMASSLVSV